MEYRVRWEIELDAKSPADAAKRAREMQLDPGAMVGGFEVDSKKRTYPIWVGLNPPFVYQGPYVHRLDRPMPLRIDPKELS